MKVNNKPKGIRISAWLLGELLVIILWTAYFIKFNTFYSNVELLISDTEPLINKILIFVTYSPKDSRTYFISGFVIVSLLTMIGISSFQRSRFTIDNRRILQLLAIINIGCIAALCKPIVFPIFIIFFIISFTAAHIKQSFSQIIELDEDDDEDEEESSEEISE